MSSKLGIVLAAGESTRLPGKVLLPTRKGPVVQSAIELCRRALCTETVVLVSGADYRDTGPLYSWIRGTQGTMGIVRQLEPRGVVNAIRETTQCMDNFRGRSFMSYLVTFGDNVYDEHEVADALDCASVRQVDAPNADQLDGVQHSVKIDAHTMTALEDSKPVWVERFKHPELKLAGWLHLSREKLERLVSSSDFLVPAMNAASVRPHVVEGMKWWDVGTPEAYAHYWRTS